MQVAIPGAVWTVLDGYGDVDTILALHVTHRQRYGSRGSRITVEGQVKDFAQLAAEARRLCTASGLLVLNDRRQMAEFAQRLQNLVDLRKDE